MINKRYFCYPAIFFIGFGSPPLVLISFFIFIFFFLTDLKVLKLKRAEFFVYLSALAFIFLIYIAFGHNVSKENLEIEFLSMVIYITLPLLYILIITPSEEHYIAMLCSFMLGLMVKVFIIVAFSFFMGGLGYNLLYDPIANIYLNSPSISNSLALLFCFVLNSKIFNSFFLKASFLLLIVLGGGFVGGRAFIILVFISLALYFSYSEYKQKIYLTFIFLIMATTVLFNSDIYNSLFERFIAEGMDSSRFDIFVDALIKIPQYPLGGFILESKSYNGTWYHNIIFDTARTSGWLGVIILCFIMVYLIVNVLKSKNKMFFSLTIISILISLQDVIMEGNKLLFVTFFFLSLLSLSISIRCRTTKHIP